jgi:hypothetical protein
MEERTTVVRLNRQWLLRHHRLAEFWNGLVINQEVRWLGAKKQTYFVHSTKRYRANPGWGMDPSRGPFIELRRHTGRTFFTQLAMVRPCIIVPPRPLFDQSIFDDDIERRGAAARERTTIHMPGYCRLCHNAGIVAIRVGDDNWDIQECPANHSEPTITVHFGWKREPRWFD